MPRDFFLVWQQISISWSCDTQEVEGLNSMITTLCNRAPNIRLALVSARTSLRKALHAEGSFAGARTFQAKQEKEKQLLECL
eukprot:3131992-Lingulodinium_polyedra.AAC.1